MLFFREGEEELLLPLFVVVVLWEAVVVVVVPPTALFKAVFDRCKTAGTGIDDKSV